MNNQLQFIKAKSLPQEDPNLFCANSNFRWVYHMSSLMISIGFGLPSIILFLSYKSLRSSKLILVIINLILAVMLRNFVILVAEVDVSFNICSFKFT